MPAWLAMETAVCKLCWRNKGYLCSSAGLASNGNRRVYFMLANYRMLVLQLGRLVMGTSRQG